MKRFSTYLGLAVLGLIALHGARTIRKESRTKSIQTTGEIVNVMIYNVDCDEGFMTFHFGAQLYKKEIDESACGLFQKGQNIQLIHNKSYSDLFVFVNEDNPSLLVFGGLEIAIGLIGFLLFWHIKENRPSSNNVHKSWRVEQ